jgi:hypothetical protein
MSKVIYNEDFISITWEIKEYETSGLSTDVIRNTIPVEINENLEIQKQLHLIFTIQVNWKLKVFEWFFVLEEVDYIENSNKSNNPTLKDWGEWYAIINLLASLWYKIWDYELWKWWGNIILEWIDELSK